MSIQNINPEKEPVPASWVPRTIKGGKEPPDSLFTPWLETLQTMTVFICGNKNSAYGCRYKLMWKGETFYLLEEYFADTVEDRYVFPYNFSRNNPEYEVLGIEEEPQIGGTHERNRSD